MARYLIIDQSGLAVNSCEWDGVAVWFPPDGHRIIHSEDVPIGAIWDGTQWTGLPEPKPGPAVIEQEPPQDV